jgi:hypothetical protein
MKISPEVAELFYVNGQTDRHDKAALCISANNPKNDTHQSKLYCSISYTPIPQLRKLKFPNSV